jgi:hypothetical protein
MRVLMNYFAIVLRRLGFCVLMFCLPLCLGQQIPDAFAEHFEDKKSEARASALCLSPRFHRKLQPGVSRCPVTIRPLVSLVRLSPAWTASRMKAFPPAPGAFRSLPMLC